MKTETSIIWEIPKEKLVEIVKNNSSFYTVSRILNLRYCSECVDILKDIFKNEDIDYSHFKYKYSKGDLICEECGMPIGGRGVTGLCRKCAGFEKRENKEAVCKECGVLINKRTKTFLCIKCAGLKRKKRTLRFCKKCRTKLYRQNKIGLCKKCFNDYRKKNKKFIVKKLEDIF